MGKNTVATIGFVLALCITFQAMGEEEKGNGKGGCRDEIRKLCPDAKPGDGNMRECIQKHESSLSAACREKIKEKMEHAKEHKPCLEDALRLCKGIDPGEGRIMHCLREHESSLSSACKEKMQEGRKHNPCMEDMERLCKGVEQGEGRIMHCMREHEQSVSSACKEFMHKRKEHMEGKMGDGEKRQDKGRQE